MTLFEQCVEAAIQEDDGGYPDYRVTVRAVLTCVLENTSSPRTVDEMVRILADAPAAAPYVA